MKVYLSQDSHTTTEISYRKNKKTHRFVIENDLLDAISESWVHIQGVNLADQIEAGLRGK